MTEKKRTEKEIEKETIDQDMTQKEKARAYDEALERKYPSDANWYLDS